MSPDTRHVEDTFQELGIDPELLHFDADGTIIHPPTREEIAAISGTAPLPRLERPGDPRDPAEQRLTFGSIIGEGAMGIIRAAQQIPLRREVAVKSIRADNYDPIAERALVLEARVTGALEHPNIVPVYSLGLDDSNRPAMVMRRLEGVAWRQFIGQKGHLKTPEPGPDPLEWHLRVLIQVCNAIHYAHIKGVIHRDLKPVNVMIGRFGEVYVLDWGLAVTVDEADLLGLPRASSVDVVIGTPGHMAPEMIDTRKRLIGQRTDVYLLGTCLHMVLTGRPRHDQSTVRERMLSALRSDPVEYGSLVPAELAEICHRAMARDPRERFSSALALRQALEAFLTHRVSQRMADEASARTLRLRAMLRHGDHPEEDKVHRLFAECRFGFRQALARVARQPVRPLGIAGALGDDGRPRTHRRRPPPRPPAARRSARTAPPARSPHRRAGHRAGHQARKARTHPAGGRRARRPRRAQPHPPAHGRRLGRDLHGLCHPRPPRHLPGRPRHHARRQRRARRHHGRLHLDLPRRARLEPRQPPLSRRALVHRHRAADLLAHRDAHRRAVQPSRSRCSC
jgi:tRNA A-37 threonylcarbamoyl transferase component Bud32